MRADSSVELYCVLPHLLFCIKKRAEGCLARLPP